MNPVEHELARIEAMDSIRQALSHAKRIIVDEHKKRLEAETQRDKLLEALEVADSMLTHLGPCPEELDDEDEKEQKDGWIQIQQAIAAVKGGGQDG